MASTMHTCPRALFQFCGHCFRVLLLFWLTRWLWRPLQIIAKASKTLGKDNILGEAEINVVKVYSLPQYSEIA